MSQEAMSEKWMHSITIIRNDKVGMMKISATQQSSNIFNAV